MLIFHTDGMPLKLSIF